MSELRNLPKIHSRETLTRDFETELGAAILEVQKRHRLLTTTELLGSLNRVFSSEIGTILKYALRQERHGNTNTPGGLEG